MARRRLLLVLLLMMAIRDTTVDAAAAGSAEASSNYHLHQLKMNKRRNVVLLEGEDHNAVCRLPDGSYLPVDLFALDTCARCYRYIPDQATFFVKKWNQSVVSVKTEPSGLMYNVTYLVDSRDQLIVAANASDANDESRLVGSFTGGSQGSGVAKWKSCCRAAVDCCRSQLSTENDSSSSSVTNNMTFSSSSSRTSSSTTCPASWDGWTCWPKTPSNQTALARCPNYIYFGTESPPCNRYAMRSCTIDGTWYRRGGIERTDYTPCGTVTMMKQRTTVHIIAYGISTLSLIPALLIFYSYKQLNVYRIRLHKNLFLSILLNSAIVILFMALVILPQMSATPSTETLIKQNALGCRFLLMLTKYFRLSNYMWMFCEGFYLHRLITAAFAEQKSFFIFYLIGWGFPLIPTGLYATVRAIYFDEKCWVEPIEAYEWLLNTPCLLSLLVNMCFLVNIIRILVIKLRTAHSNEPSQYRKAVRATLVLVPLFGLHFILTIYRPQNHGCEWTELYHYFNALLDGLQGLLVAIIFCYANGEVHYLLKRSYKRQKEERCSGARNRSHRLNSLPGNGDGGAERMRELGNRSGTGETGRSWRRSIFLGRSTAGSTTHFSSADASPNPLQKQMNLTVVPVILPAQPAHKQLSTIPSEEPSSVSEPVNGYPAIREPLLVRETCLEN